jgi:hypothetical protein
MVGGANPNTTVNVPSTPAVNLPQINPPAPSADSGTASPSSPQDSQSPDVLGTIGDVLKGALMYVPNAFKSVTIDPIQAEIARSQGDAAGYKQAMNNEAEDNPFAPVVHAGQQLSSAIFAGTGGVDQAANKAKQDAVDAWTPVVGNSPAAKAFIDEAGNAAASDIYNNFLGQQGIDQNTPGWQVGLKAASTQAGIAAPLAFADPLSMFNPAKNIYDRITGNTARASAANVLSGVEDAGAIQSALGISKDAADFIAQQHDPNVIQQILKELNVRPNPKEMVRTLNDVMNAASHEPLPGETAGKQGNQSNQLQILDPMNPDQSQLPAGWHPDGAADPVPVLENAARTAPSVSDFQTYINGLSGEDKAAATSALNGMTPEDFYNAAGGGTSKVVKPDTGAASLPQEDRAAIQAAGGTVPNPTAEAPITYVTDPKTGAQTPMMQGDVIDRISELSSIPRDERTVAQGTELSDLKKVLKNRGTQETDTTANKSIPAEDQAAIQQAGGQLPTANEVGAEATGNNSAAPLTGTRAGTTRINDAMGTDLPESTYDKRPQAVLKANSESAAAANLDDFTKRVQVALAKPAGSLTDQELSDAYVAAQHQLEAGNRDVANQILADTLPHDTATAQSLAARNMIAAQSPQGIRKMVVSALDKAGVPLEGDLKTNIEYLMDEIGKTEPNTYERQLLERNLADTVARAIPRSKVTAVKEFWKAMLISGPETAAKVLISQPISAGQAYLSQYPAAAYDATRAALTGGERTTAVAPFRYFLRGAAKGVDSSIYKVRTGIDTPGSGGFAPASLKQALQEGHQQTAIERGIFKLHGAFQKPAMEGIRDTTLAQLGKAEGLNKGLSGTELRQYIDDYVNSPPQDAYAHAIHAGEEASNQQRTALGNAASKIQQSGKGLGNIIAPITRVPGAVGTNALYNYSGLKLAKTLLYDGIIKQGKDPNFARTVAEDFGKAVIGAGGVQGLGALLGATGNLTPPKAENPKQAALYKAQGKIYGGVHIPGTDFWISLNALGPVGIELATGGGFGRGLGGDSIVKGSSGIPGAAIEGLASGAQELSQQPYVQGITGVGNALQDPIRYARSFASNLIGSAVPAFVSQTATGTDDVQRTTDYNNPLDVVKSKVPFLRETLPTSYDMLGNTNQGSNPSASPLGGVFGTLDAFKLSAVKGNTDPALQEVSRLYDALPSADAPAISDPTRSQTVEATDATGKVKSSNINLTDQQLSDYTKNSGDLIHSGITNLINNPYYSTLSDANKAKAINQIIVDAHDATKVALLGSQPKTLSDGVRTALNDSTNFGKNIGPVNYATTPVAQDYFNRWNTMDKTQQDAWLKAPADQNGVQLADELNQQRTKGLPAYQPSNALTQLYAKYEDDINSHQGTIAGKPQYTPLDLRQKAEAFQKAASVLSLSPIQQDIYQSGGSEDVRTLIQNGKLSKADLDAAVNLDDQMYASGLDTSLKFSKTFRTALGYGTPASNGTSSSSSSSGSGTNQRLTTLLSKSGFIPQEIARPSLAGVPGTTGQPTGKVTPKFSAAMRQNPVSPLKFQAPNVTPSKGATRVTIAPYRTVYARSLSNVAQ